MRHSASKVTALSKSSSDNVSTVVCMYRRGIVIKAEGTPALEYAKASVSVPVPRVATSRWKGIFSLQQCPIQDQAYDCEPLEHRSQ